MSSWSILTDEQKAKKQAWIKGYEKTERGFLMRLYRNMKSRITGVQKTKHHLYKDKYLLPKEDFYKWAESDKVFHKLFRDYENSNYERKLAPSVDRIDPNIGYRLSNMEFVTMSENSRRGSINAHKVVKKNNKSGVVGVCFAKSMNKWHAYMHVNGKANHLGYFDNKEDAIKARKDFEASL